jgi:hypothetical protein
MIKKMFILWFCCFATAKAEPIMLFDAHLHYGGEDVKAFSTQEILNIFDQAGVKYALISSTPNDGTEALFEAAPTRILPFLGFYRSLKEKGDWMWNPDVLDRVKKRLASFDYIGLGEFHIFKKDMNSPIFAELVRLAAEKNLWLQFHGDAEVLDRIYEISADSKVLWAHMGTRPQPDFLRPILQKYQGRLWIDTTVRDKQLLGEDGKLDSAWVKLFTDYADSFVIGVDTFSVNRWKTFSMVTDDIRAWLNQLPVEVRHKLAFDNAYGLFEDYIKLQGKKALK